MTYRLAQFVSAVFHPLLMPTFLFACFFSFAPELLGVGILDWSARGSLLTFLFLNTFVLPSLCIYYPYRAKIVPDLFLTESKQRHWPYLITIGLYCVTIYLLQYRLSPISEIAPRLAICLLSTVVALIGVTIINKFWKISAHATGIGGVIGALLYVSYTFNADTLLYPLLVSILLAGLIGSARLFLHAHTPWQIIAGMAVGLGSTITTFFFLF